MHSAGFSVSLWSLDRIATILTQFYVVLPVFIPFLLRSTEFDSDFREFYRLLMFFYRISPGFS